MKLTLINNAIDSLQIAMKTYHRWNNNYYKWNNKNEENWDLKITVEFLHNAIELLVKAILLKIDDQSIYCDRQEEIIEEARKEVVRKNILLEEYLIKNDKIKTCSYEEVLEKYFKINSEYPNRAKICLKRLGTYRNRIMHFGIDADENGDFFDLLAVIHESFNIILIDNFYEDLLKVDEYFEYNDVVDILEPLQECNEDDWKKFAAKIPQKNISNFLGILEKTVKSSELNSFLQYYDIEIEDKSVYEDNDIDLRFKCKEKMISFSTIYDALYNCTTFVKFNYPYRMICSIMHSDNKIYIYNDNKEYDNKKIDSLYNIQLGKTSGIKPLTENNIRNSLVSVLKKTILSSEWEDPDDY